MPTVYRLCASIGWVFGIASLVAAIAVRLNVLPAAFDLGASPRGILDFAMAWFLLSIVSRAILQVETEHGVLP